MISLPKDRFEELRPSFIKWTYISATLLLVGLIVTFFTFGRIPNYQFGVEGRTLVAIFTMIALAALLFSGGILLFAWLLNKYADR